MADPITFAAVGAVVLTEGIKFLYGQVGEILKRRRERKAAGAESSAAPSKEPVPMVADASASALQGKLEPTVADFDKLEQVADSMMTIRDSLTSYKEGERDVKPDDAELAAKVDTLRRQLEAVLGQRITFKGEKREGTGTPVVVGGVELKTLSGDASAAGVRIGTATGGAQIEGHATADEAKDRARISGVEITELRGS